MVNLSNYLKTKTGYSSLRLNALLVVIVGNFSLIGVTAYIIIATVKELAVDWSGIALYVASLAGYVGVAFWGKNKGKEYEMINETNKTTNKNDTDTKEIVAQ